MKFFIYARKSTDDEERQILSIEAQLAELREYAAKESLPVAQEFVESMTAKVPGRPIFNEMIKAIEKGQAQGVIAWHPDRLARNSVDGGRIIYMLDTGKLKALKCPTFWFEDTPQGKFMLNIAFGQSKYYVDNLSENVKRGFRQKVRNGVFPGRPPVGYLNEPRTRNIVIDEQKAPLVRKLFDAYATGGYTFDDLRDMAADIGLTSFSGGPIYKSAIPRMLSEPFYIGLFRFKGEIHEGKHDPLIPRTLFDEIQAIMERRGRNHKHHREDRLPYLALMRCHVCASGITAQRQKGHHYYCCTKKFGPCDQGKYLREELLTEDFRAVFTRVSLSDEKVNAIFAQLDAWQAEESGKTSSAVQRQKDKLADIQTKIQRLLDVYLEGSISKEEYTARKQQFLREKALLTDRMAETSRKGCGWIEPMRAFITQCVQARNESRVEDLDEIARFTRKVGLNLRLQGASVPKPEADESEIWLRKSSDWKSGRVPILERLRGGFATRADLRNRQNPSGNPSSAHDARLRASPQTLDVRGLLSVPSVFCFQVADRQPVLRVEYPMPWKIVAEFAETEKWSGREDLNLRRLAPKTSALPD